MRNTNSVSKKSWLLVALCYLFILLSPPLYFYTMYFPSNIIPGGIRAAILIFMILKLIGQKNKPNIKTKRVVPCAVLLVLYTLISSALNIDYATRLAHISMCLLFSIVVYVYYINDKEFAVGMRMVIKPLILIVSLSIIISPVLFLIAPGLFIQMYFNDYYITFNPLLGSIEAQVFRPCWYFAEPSYCGFFLGLSFIMILGMEVKQKMKYLLLLIIIAAIIVTNSMSTILFIVPSFIIWLIRRFLNRKLYSFILGVSLIIVNISIVTIDFDSLLDKYEISFNNNHSSFEDRKSKIENSQTLLQTMSIIDYLIGTGIDYTADWFDSGESNGYFKLLCEYGIFFTIAFLIIVNKLTNQNIAMETYFLLSLMSVIIFWTPMILVLLIIANKDNYLSPCLTAQRKNK